MDKMSSDQIVAMLTLSEEIGMLNYKVKQLVQDLHNTSNVLGGLQDLADNLNSKVGQLRKGANSYKPDEVPIGEEATPSNVAETGKRERIVPTPENWRDYAPEPRQPVASAGRVTQPPTMPTKRPVESKKQTREQYNNKYAKKTKEDRVRKQVERKAKRSAEEKRGTKTKRFFKR
tara:strand:- start:418 stop:942 length:525 start_codon:yes stop_codon:yes gene_type:complete